MSNWLGAADSALNSGASILDRARIRLLQLSLFLTALRWAYVSRPARHACRFMALNIAYIPLAILRPDILLIAGPLVFGYSHLVSSYRFVSTSMKPNTQFRVFLLATFAGLFLRLLTSRGVIEQWPGGALEALVAALVLVAMTMKKSANFAGALLAALFTGLAIRFAWEEPIIFVGGVLIFHNWIAFFTWVAEAPIGADRRVAQASTCFFALVHILVLSGAVDSWLLLDRWDEISRGAWTAGWLLTGGADDAILLYRAVVLYTYGISLHYFIWLRAIPECRSKGQAPTSFRRSLDLLRADLGPKTLAAVILIGFAGTILWVAKPALGAAIYFGWAAMHGWLETVYLLAKIGLRADLSRAS